MADHGHGGGHGHEEEKKGPRIPIRWFVLAAVLIAGVFLLSKCERGEGGNNRQDERPAAAASAASAPVGFCVDIPNQVVTAPVNGWSDAILVPAGCTIYRDATNIRTQCRNDGEREWRNADVSGACIGDMERHQSKVGEPVTQTVYFRPD